MKKIKILILYPNQLYGGIQSYIYANLQHMDLLKYEIDMLTSVEGLENIPECKKYGFGVRRFTKTSAQNEEVFVNQIRDILAKGYDVFHLHTCWWTGLLLEKLAIEAGIPKVIVHSHSTSIDVEDDLQRKQMTNIHETYRKQFNLSMATDFCACSNKAAEWLFGDSIAKNKIRILHNAIDLRRFTYREEFRKSVRKELGVEGKYAIGHNGRFSYLKNHEFLIRVFYRLHKLRHETVLILIGSGELEHNIKQQIRRLGIEDSVILVGFTEKPELYYCAMDVFAFPSIREGLPVSVIEAQASDLPCLVSNLVTEEVKILDSTKLLPLNEEIWVEEIEKHVNARHKRKDVQKEMTLAGYNIVEEVKRLEVIYTGEMGEGE